MNTQSKLLLAALLAAGSMTPAVYARRQAKTEAAEQVTQTPRQAKYVFYFISDGTGVNTILGAEMYQAAVAGYIGRQQLCLTQFPVVGVSSTYSHSHGITDSAASGTALATSRKTTNRYMGELPDETPVNSIAVWAREAGRRVGVATSVNINHATPGAFYAHEKDRGMYYEIASWLPRAGFDFYGGSDFHVKTPQGQPDPYQLTRDAGYVITRGFDEYRAQADTARRMVLFQPQAASDRDDYSIPYAIDARPEDLTIPQILTAELDFLMKDSTQGFFLMNEIGGKVDFACHGNDGAAAFAEVAAVDSCVRIAYDFYLRHPEETLIVLTADHETGGLVLANRNVKALNLALLANQDCSQDAFTALLKELRRTTDGQVSWDQVKDLLAEHFGYWGAVQLTQAEEDDLRAVYEKSFRGQMDNEKNLYSENEPLAAEAVRILNTKAGLTWCTGGHSAGLVPVYACGVGAEQFAGHNDNSQIPLIIARIAGYEVKN